MNELLPLLLAFVFGLLLGLFFFVGLWWTVRKGLTSTRPALWFLGSLVLRCSVVVAGFYWLGTTGQWQQLVAALLAFVQTRVAVTRGLPRGH
jgi:F1F0 ATPase subunit 2